MRPVPSHTLERWSASRTTLCTCWRIICRDSTEMGLTDHDTALSFAGTTFEASGGAGGSALATSSDLSPDNAEIVGAFDAEVLGEDLLSSGRLDDAVVEVWRVDWEDVEARLLLRTGNIGVVERAGEGYTAEFRSLKHRLDRPVGRIYGRTCDAALGDGRCGVAITTAPFGATATIVSIDGSEISVSLDHQPSHDLDGGTLRIDADGGGEIVRSIREARTNDDTATVTVWEPILVPVAPGTSCRVTVGCDKRLETCRDVFSNAVNFRGFPFIPGTDILTRTPTPQDTP